jgi:hypothetical protein
MKSPIDLARRMRTSVQIVTLVATLVGCGEDTPPHHTAIPCEGIADCKDPATAPVCAYTLSTDCHATTKKCLYRCKNSASCPCLETEIATCNMAGGGGMAGAGYHQCQRVPLGAGRSSITAWGGCGNL